MYNILQSVYRCALSRINFTIFFIIIEVIMCQELHDGLLVVKQISLYNNIPIIISFGIQVPQCAVSCVPCTLYTVQGWGDIRTILMGENIRKFISLPITNYFNWSLYWQVLLCTLNRLINATSHPQKDVLSPAKVWSHWLFCRVLVEYWQMV